MLQFVTMYYNTQNIDILKSPGKIPYYVAKLSGKYKSRLVTFKNENYTYQQSMQDHLDFVALPYRSRFEQKYLLPLLGYLIRHAKTIDVLHLYHIRYGTFVKGLIYKILNPRGVLYVKLDGEWTLRDCFPKEGLKGIAKAIDFFRPFALLFRGIVYLSNLISIETEELYAYLQGKNDRELNRKLFLNPYGIDVNELMSNESTQIAKENIIMTVGRIGTPQKNTEMLLNALTKLKTLSDWKVLIVGPVEPAFQTKIAEFHRLNPQLQDIVKFVGNVSDRKQLCSYYQRSKCFLLTSRFESWAIVLTEAAFYKNYLISTDVGCVKELIIDHEIGEMVSQENADELADKIEAVVSRKKYLTESAGNRIRQYCIDKFSWEKVALQLIKEMQGRC